jgi:dipeptidyl aminopeptidase/acylaminoacyl peptidase
MELVRFDVSGTSHVTLVDGPRSVFLVAVTDSQLVYGVSDAFTPPDLYLADLDGSNERRLTHLNEALLTELRRPTLEHLQFKGADGVDVEGWYLRPTADGAQAPYPTILKIHGGPHAGYGHIFSFDFHMLTGAGYGVLYINHRGSTGYGADFATKIIGDWGNHDYHDLMAGVDEAIARGLADPDRLGVSGLSGGGNLSCWIVGHTDRFKAAMPENPVTSWLSFYGVSDIGPWFAVRELGGHPHEIPEVYARCSPLTYAHQCRTPTLLVQADHDWRCPPEQSEQFYTALKVAGCTVEMLRLPLGGHASSIIGPLEMRLAHNDALLEWMGRYVMAPADH